jgi:ABC-2 type transport system permease protein
MIAPAAEAPAGLVHARAELRKLAAFVRRDFLVAWSYRMSFVSDLVGLASLTVMFHFIGLMVDPGTLPTYGGTQVTYLEFAVVGITLGLFMQLALNRVSGAIRNEQLMGTLESLLLTPTSLSTVQLGSVGFDFLYIPLRTGVFLVTISVVFGLHFEPDGVLPALAVLTAFIPVIWGLGVASGAVILTYKRGGGLVATAMLGLALLSGVYFPIDLLPDWAASIAAVNPIALTIDGMRESLLGGGSWATVLPTIAVLVPTGICSLLAGMGLFRLALARERRRGSLGIY